MIFRNRVYEIFQSDPYWMEKLIHNIHLGVKVLTTCLRDGLKMRYFYVRAI